MTDQNKGFSFNKFFSSFSANMQPAFERLNKQAELRRQRATESDDLFSEGFPDYVGGISGSEKFFYNQLLTQMGKQSGKDLSQWKKD